MPWNSGIRSHDRHRCCSGPSMHRYGGLLAQPRGSTDSYLWSDPRCSRGLVVALHQRQAHRLPPSSRWLGRERASRLTDRRGRDAPIPSARNTRLVDSSSGGAKWSLGCRRLSPIQRSCCSFPRTAHGLRRCWYPRLPRALPSRHAQCRRSRRSSHRRSTTCDCHPWEYRSSE